MGGVGKAIFGGPAKSKNQSSSTSNWSNQSESGNQAYPFLQEQLAGPTGFLGAGGNMMGSLLGINNSGNPGAAPAPTGPPPLAGPQPSSPLRPVTPPSDMWQQPNKRLQLTRQEKLTNPIGNGTTIPPVGATPAPTPGQGGSSPQSDALNQWTNSAGFNFLLDKGKNDIYSSQAAKGMFQSGATGEALEEMRHNLASTYLDKYMSQVLDYSKLGLGAAGTLAGAGNYSNSSGSGSSTSSGSGTNQGGKTGLLPMLAGAAAQGAKAGAGG